MRMLNGGRKVQGELVDEDLREEIRDFVGMWMAMGRLEVLENIKELNYRGIDSFHLDVDVQDAGELGGDGEQKYDEF